MQSGDQYEKDLRRAYKTVARVVRDYGTNYLVIFERLHKELEQLKSNKIVLDLALTIADDE